MAPETSNGTAASPAESLRRHLATVLPLDKIVIKTLQETLENLDHQLLPLTGRPLGALLMDPATNITALRTIKDYAKSLTRDAGESKTERDTVLTIYFAAIASVLVHHRDKITTHSTAELERAFLAMTRKSWMPPDLAELFEHARRLCQRQK